MARRPRLRLLPRLGLTLGVVAGLCVTVPAAPAWAAGSASAAADRDPCASLPVDSSAPGEPTAETTTNPGDDLAAARQCDHSLLADQSFWEAVLAGAGLIAFGGATLFYRSRRHRAPASGG